MQLDKFDEALARFHEGMDAMSTKTPDSEVEGADLTEHALRSNEERFHLLAASAVWEDHSPLFRLFLDGLVNGIPAGVDETVIQVLLDSLAVGQAPPLDLAKEAHLVEICLPNLRADFTRGLRLIHPDRRVYPQPPELTIEQVEDALLANNAEGLIAVAMQGGGELFGLDKNGKFLFKDRGNEPVMFGFDQADRPIMAYNRNPAQMAQIRRYADYYQIYEAVYGPEDAPTGYELFPDCPDLQTTGMTEAIEEITGAPFVSSTDGDEFLFSALDNGRNPDRDAYARFLGFNPHNQWTSIYSDNPNGENMYRGAVRLLRV